MKLIRFLSLILLALAASWPLCAAEPLRIVQDSFSAMGPRIITTADQQKAEQQAVSNPGVVEDPYGPTAMHKAMQEAALVQDPYAQNLPQQTALEQPQVGTSVAAAPLALPQAAEHVVRELQAEVHAKEMALKAGVQEQLGVLQLQIQDRATKMRQEADEIAQKVRQKTEGDVQQLISAASAQVNKITEQVAQEAVRIKQVAAQKALVAINKAEEEAMLRRLHASQQMLAQQFGLPAQVSQAIHTPTVGFSGAAEKLSPQGQMSNLLQRVGAPVLADQPVSFATSTAGQGSGFLSSVVSDTALKEVPLKVTAEWKNDISRQFYNDMTMMKDIIVSAESPHEAKEFLNKFKEQNLWFDNTLRTTNFVTDDGYKKIQAKQERLARIMQAQRKADEDLAVLTKGLNIDPQLVKKVRLTMLYDLNAMVVQREHHLDAAQRYAPLPGEEINMVVKRTLAMSSHQFQELAAQFPDVTFKDNKTARLSIPSMVQQLQEELDRLRDDFRDATTELSTTKTKLVDAENHLKTTATVIKTVKKELTAAQQAREDLVKKNKAIKTVAVAVIDKEIKEKVDLELSLNGALQTVARQQKDLARMSVINGRLQTINKTLLTRSEQLDKLLLDSALDVHNEKEKLIVQADRTGREMARVREGYEKDKLGLQTEVAQAKEQLAHMQQERAALQLEVAGAAQLLRGAKGLQLQAQERAALTEELAQKTIDSINNYLHDEKNALVFARRDLKAREQEIDHRERVNAHEDELLDKQRNALIAHQASLTEEKQLLESIKNQTKNMMQNAAKMSLEQQTELLAMQKEIEEELRQIKSETQEEIADARQELEQAARHIHEQEFSLKKTQQESSIMAQGVSAKMPGHAA